MRLTVRVETNIRTRAIAAAGQGFAREFADRLAELTAEHARANVAPGSGPGPHPHRPVPPFWAHVDTGDLMRSVKVEPESRGFLETTRVFSTLPYAVFLEVGWHSRSGLLWRYPWLYPALMQAQQETADIARSTGRRWFSDEGAPYRGRVNFASPVSATAWPE